VFFSHSFRPLYSFARYTLHLRLVLSSPFVICPLLALPSLTSPHTQDAQRRDAFDPKQHPTHDTCDLKEEEEEEGVVGCVYRRG
jgi:hypothetical protein